MSKPERPARRMLLVASVGVATMSYVVACEKSPAAGNLMAPPSLEVPPMPDSGAGANPATTASVASASPEDAGPPPDPVRPPTSGNLMAPHSPAKPTPSSSAKPLKPFKPPPTSGNLMSP